MTSLSRRRLLRLGIVAAAAGCTPAVRDVVAPASTAPTTATSPSATTAPPVTASTPAPTTPAPRPTPVAQPLVCRAAWGADPPAGAGPDHTVTRLTIHHSAGAATDTTQGPAHLRGYQRYHVDDLGWPDIAYHVCVDRAGVAYDLRAWDQAGDTSTDYDPAGHFLLLLDGDFDQHDLSEPQAATAARVLAWAAEHFDVGLDTTTGHRDHASTACPGDALYARIPALVAEAAHLRDEGGVRLVEACGAAAAEAVAALEGGAPPGPPVVPRPTRTP